MASSRAAALICGMTAVLLLSASGPAGAKMPPFEVEVTPRTVSQGQSVSVRVTVMDWRNPDRVFTDFGADRLDGLLGVHPATALTPKGRPAVGTGPGIPIGLRAVRPGVYRGTVALADAGEYAIVAFPDLRQAIHGYAAPVRVRVTPEQDARSDHHCVLQR